MRQEEKWRKVLMLCPTCGGTEFSADEEEGELVKCASCHRKITKDELVAENAENINANIEEMADEVVQDLGRYLRDSLKRSFRGSKGIRIR